jgi:hypothetical protein
MSDPHKIRSSGQRERILELLQERGPDGATNVEFNEICFRYGAQGARRTRELRDRAMPLFAGVRS